MTVIVILLIVGGLGYFGWEVWRTVSSIWRSIARFLDSLGKSADRMARIEAPIIPAPAAETPRQTRARIALERDRRRHERLTRTIERWDHIYHG